MLTSEVMTALPNKSEMNKTSKSVAWERRRNIGKSLWSAYPMCSVVFGATCGLTGQFISRMKRKQCGSVFWLTVGTLVCFVTTVCCQPRTVLHTALGVVSYCGWTSGGICTEVTFSRTVQRSHVQRNCTEVTRSVELYRDHTFSRTVQRSHVQRTCTEVTRSVELYRGHTFSRTVQRSHVQ